MYWLGCEEYDPEFFREKKQRARKEHECCECGKKIQAGIEYFYNVGKWYGSLKGEFLFQTHKTCLSCDKDWKEVIAVFYRNREYNVCIIFGGLKEAIESALEYNFLREDGSLALKWFPKEDVEASFWEKIKDTAIREGLQPALPGL